MSCLTKLEVILFLLIRAIFLALNIIQPLIYSYKRGEEGRESSQAYPVKVTSQFTNRSLETTFMDLCRSKLFHWGEVGGRVLLNLTVSINCYSFSRGKCTIICNKPIIKKKKKKKSELLLYISLALVPYPSCKFFGSLLLLHNI